MEWKKCYLDYFLVPLGVFITMGYHGLLWYQVKNHPLHTTIGVNAIGRRLWFQSMIKENGKKNIIAVQTLRQSLMECTLMATASILLSCGMAAFISSTYSLKKPLNDTAYGARDEFMISLKYSALLLFFMFSFLCHLLAVRFLNQVNYLINTTQFQSPFVTPQYVCEMFERGFVFSTIGNRAFYVAFPLLFWMLGPILPFVCSVATVTVLYNLDFNSISKAANPK